MCYGQVTAALPNFKSLTIYTRIADDSRYPWTKIEWTCTWPTLANTGHNWKTLRIQSTYGESDTLIRLLNWHFEKLRDVELCRDR